MTVIRTKSEAIKMASVIRILHQLALSPRIPQASPNFTLPGIIVNTCTAARHRETPDPILQLFGIQPDHDSDITRVEALVRG